MGGLLLNMQEVKHIVCRYFHENWNCEGRHHTCRLILCPSQKVPFHPFMWG